MHRRRCQHVLLSLVAFPRRFFGPGDSLVIDPTGARVVTLVDSDCTTCDLYLVLLGGPGTAAEQLNRPLPSGAGIDSFSYAWDGRRVVYIADQEVAGKQELYAVDDSGWSLVPRLWLPITLK